MHPMFFGRGLHNRRNIVARSAGSSMTSVFRNANGTQASPTNSRMLAVPIITPLMLRRMPSRDYSATPDARDFNPATTIAKQTAEHPEICLFSSWGLRRPAEFSILRYVVVQRSNTTQGDSTISPPPGETGGPPAAGCCPTGAADSDSVRVERPARSNGRYYQTHRREAGRNQRRE